MLKNATGSIKQLFRNNMKVVENYFFSTILQMISSLFGILIYPYLIRSLGADSYGLYVFAFSVTTYFISFISFGFNFPAIKAIAQNKDNLHVKSTIISNVISAKIYLAFCSMVVFSALTLSIPFMRNHWIIFSLCFIQIFGEVLFPIWYFQGIQKMRFVTYIQLGFRILTVPFIFWLVRNPDDCEIYVVITSFAVIMGAIVSLRVLKVNEKIQFRLISLRELKSTFAEALPFFWSSSAGTIKQSSVAIIIGSFFSMFDLALYDLANKIIIIPRTLTMSINSSLFPKIVANPRNEIIKKMIAYETIIGLIIIALIAIFGHWIILLVGGETMLDSYPLTVILSISVLVWLVVGACISFIFVPANRYYFVTKNQLIALASFVIFCIAGLFISKNIMMVVVALTLSGLFEIVYCYYLIKKHKLL